MTSSVRTTVVVELTPPGRAAVSVIVVAGPEALPVVDRCFVARSGRAVGDIPIGRIVLGHWGGPDGEELVLCRRDELQIEVHCHGGTAAVAAVVSRLVSEGCQRLTWQKWIDQRAPDAVQAAAQIALADAATERTAAILLDQLNGALTKVICEIIADIAAAKWSAAAETIDDLLRRRELGPHLTNPWRVVVCGEPNVGKSSLINALAGYERAIVSPIPGTTRDVVTVTTAIDGWPVQLFDTAGLREAEDELESAGIRLATNTLAQAELAIFVYDAATLTEGTSEITIKVKLESHASHARAVHVINKIDLVSASDRLPLLQQFTGAQSEFAQLHAISALTGDGVTELISAISRALVPVSFSAGTAVPFTAAQVDSLAAAKIAIHERDARTATDLLHALLTNAT